jgi:hypothetical protein
VVEFAFAVPLVPFLLLGTHGGQQFSDPSSNRLRSRSARCRPAARQVPFGPPYFAAAQ